jgi:hypothetical protein
MVFAFLDGHAAALPVDKCIVQINEGGYSGFYDLNWPRHTTNGGFPYYDTDQ